MTEDLFLGACIQFDIVKQMEIEISGNQLTYHQGMLEASARLGISPLGPDAKNMRNDLIHEGQLSGSNFPNRTKDECATVIAESLKWLDRFVIVSACASGEISMTPIWHADEIARSLPAFSL